jgi:GT2 family glycosyltransferase
MISISIVIPSYNGKELLRESLPSILNSIGPNSGHEMIVVDDGSNDDTISFLSSDFPQVRAIHLEQNRGFAKAAAEGILASRNRIVALVNNDVAVEKDFLGPLLSPFANDNIFAVGPKTLRGDGKSYYHLRSRAFFKKGEVNIIRDLEDRGETWYVSGGMALFDKEKFYDLGGFDDLFHPFYWEDADLCYRALKKGYKILFEPDSVFYHKDQGTIVFSKKGRLELFLAKLYARIVQERNQYLFTWKNILDRRLILRHIFWIPIHLFLSFGDKDHLFKPTGFAFALMRLGKALKKRKEEKRKEYVLNDRQILDIPN